MGVLRVKGKYDHRVSSLSLSVFLPIRDLDLVLSLSLSLLEEQQQRRRTEKNSFDRRKNISLVVPVLKFHRIHTSSLVLLKYYSNHNQH